MRKPFQIGDKITGRKITSDVWTIVGKSLSGRVLIQRVEGHPAIEMNDPSNWEHYAEPKVGYVNIYGGTVTSAIHSSRSRADEFSKNNGGSHHRVACVKITYREGQFDD